MTNEKKRLVPELRFRGFTDDWEQRKLGDISKISTGKLDANAMVENGRYDFYTSGIKKNIRLMYQLLKAQQLQLQVMVPQ